MVFDSGNMNKEETESICQVVGGINCLLKGTKCGFQTAAMLGEVDFDITEPLLLVKVHQYSVILPSSSRIFFIS